LNKQLLDLDRVGNVLVGLFHRLALFVIGAATVYSAGWAFLDMFNKPAASIGDLLLLFIYLEIGAMVGIYFKTNHMPVRFLVYIAITALTRHMVDLVALHPERMWEIAVMGATTLILAISVAVLRFASHRYPRDRKDDHL
jgi:phosphate starvation-inducible membrane PsiE